MTKLAIAIVILIGLAIALSYPEIAIVHLATVAINYAVLRILIVACIVFRIKTMNYPSRRYADSIFTQTERFDLNNLVRNYENTIQHREQIYQEAHDNGFFLKVDQDRFDERNPRAREVNAQLDSLERQSRKIYRNIDDVSLAWRQRFEKWQRDVSILYATQTGVIVYLVSFTVFSIAKPLSLPYDVASYLSGIAATCVWFIWHWRLKTAITGVIVYLVSVEVLTNAEPVLLPYTVASFLSGIVAAWLWFIWHWRLKKEFPFHSIQDGVPASMPQNNTQAENEFQASDGSTETRAC